MFQFHCPQIASLVKCFRYQAILALLRWTGINGHDANRAQSDIDTTKLSISLERRLLVCLAFISSALSTAQVRCYEADRFSHLDSSTSFPLTFSQSFILEGIGSSPFLLNKGVLFATPPTQRHLSWPQAQRGEWKKAVFKESLVLVDMWRKTFVWNCCGLFGEKGFFFAFDKGRNKISTAFFDKYEARKHKAYKQSANLTLKEGEKKLNSGSKKTIKIETAYNGDWKATNGFV